jgi:hypothetical protein
MELKKPANCWQNIFQELKVSKLIFTAFNKPPDKNAGYLL